MDIAAVHPQDASKRPGTTSLLALKSVREHAKELDIELPPLPPGEHRLQQQQAACAAALHVDSICAEASAPTCVVQLWQRKPQANPAVATMLVLVLPACKQCLVSHAAALLIYVCA